jgi:hypothetical protein
MNQANMYRSIARATGESLTRVRQMGFSLIVVPTARPHRRSARSSQSRSARGSAGASPTEHTNQT